MKNYALISVQDKNKLSYICKILNKYKIKILSTGGTSNKIKKLGFLTKKIKDITNFNEILDGRVKTLHPKIHGGILYDRKNPIHKKIIKKNKIPTINYVIVNLYKFKKTVEEKKIHDECLENIDIGGHSLIRSAAKNYKYVNVLTNINDYKKLEKELKRNKGETSLNFKKNLANKAYKLIYEYDSQISKWFNKNYYKIKNKNLKKLKYGENPHQKASLYLNKKNKYPNFDKLYGKEISYNNINDVISAISCLNDLPNTGVVVLKHTNPCGVACHNNISVALKRALKCDTRSSYGGIVALNKNIDSRIIKNFKHIFLDIIIAPNFTKDALNTLKKKNVIILKLKKQKKFKTFKEIKSIPGGYLKQDSNNIILNKKILKCVTRLKSNKKYLDDMIFAFIVAKHVKSNAIVLANNKQVLGIGAGQMSRIDAINIALNKMKNNFGKMKPFVFASDGFLPFSDNISLFKNTKCKGIIQPGGSKNDKTLIKKANDLGIPMYFTGIRHFKH